MSYFLRAFINYIHFNEDSAQKFKEVSSPYSKLVSDVKNILTYQYNRFQKY